jgi:hypothetical protein
LRQSLGKIVLTISSKHSQSKDGLNFDTFTVFVMICCYWWSCRRMVSQHHSQPCMRVGADSRVFTFSNRPQGGGGRHTKELQIHLSNVQAAAQAGLKMFYDAVEALLPGASACSLSLKDLGPSFQNTHENFGGGDFFFYHNSPSEEHSALLAFVEELVGLYEKPDDRHGLYASGKPHVLNMLRFQEKQQDALRALQFVLYLDCGVAPRNITLEDAEWRGKKRQMRLYGTLAYYLGWGRSKGAGLQSNRHSDICMLSERSSLALMVFLAVAQQALIVAVTLFEEGGHTDPG